MPKKRKEREGREKAAASANQAKGKYTVDQLLDKAEECIDMYNYEVAQKFCQRALELDCDNVRALETSGTLLLEVGNVEAAKQCFGRAVELQPEEGHAKYMYLGQLFGGTDCVQYFSKGIELMSKQLKQQQEQQQQAPAAAAALENGESAAAAAASSAQQQVTARDISDAYLSIAEVYFTDKCDDASAEELCKANIEEALKADDSNPEAHRLMADYWLVQDEKESAREAIKKSISFWLDKAKAAAEGNVPDDEYDPVDVVPLSYQSRLKTARVLIEVQEFEDAVDILDLLVDEEDEVTDVWYLLGWANYLQGDDYKGNARFYLLKAKEVSVKFQNNDEQMAQHIDELLLELGPEPEELSDNEDNKDGSDIESSGNEEEPMDDTAPA